MALDDVEILLVEDNDGGAELMRRALWRGGLSARLHRVADGAEALEFLSGQGRYQGRNVDNLPRVVLLDLTLPKVDGLHVLRTIKERDVWRGIPVVILSSSDEDRDMAEAYRLGANSYVAKPVEFDKFASAVVQVGLYWTRLNGRPRR